MKVDYNSKHEKISQNNSKCYIFSLILKKQNQILILTQISQFYILVKQKYIPFFTLKIIYTWSGIEFEDCDYLNLIFKRLYLLDMIMLSLI